MTPTPILGLSLAVCCAGEPKLPSYHFVPRVPAIDEKFHRDHLAIVRRGRALIESNIKLFEKLLEDDPDSFTPKKASELRQKLEEWREEVEKSKKIERELELYEQQRKLKPGLETDLAAIERLDKLHKELWPDRAIAPMPREIKPRDPGVKP